MSVSQVGSGAIRSMLSMLAECALRSGWSQSQLSVSMRAQVARGGTVCSCARSTSQPLQPLHDKPPKIIHPSRPAGSQIPHHL